MTRASKIVPIRSEAPVPSPSIDDNVFALVDGLSAALRDSVRDMLANIRAAENDAIRRLNEYTPTEPLMDRNLAAAYLRIQPRTVDYLSSPSVMELPFVWIGGVKRFRKKSLDAWLDDRETKKAKVKP
jgi:hypothetical protein